MFDKNNLPIFFLLMNYNTSGPASLLRVVLKNKNPEFTNKMIDTIVKIYQDALLKWYVDGYETAKDKYLTMMNDVFHDIS